ncbi:hypothetical protein GQ57_15250 [Burkholderia sp. MSh2]|nr:hypothetical protein GQ57_15250 [Burkholderia sp. MSh2]KFG97239.1 hypothetical protein GQ56_0110310 [Burkholderia paludis]
MCGGWIAGDQRWSWIFCVNVTGGLFAATIRAFHRNRVASARKLSIDGAGLAERARSAIDRCAMDRA